MTKRNTIIYWVFTLWMSLGMVSTGIVQLLLTLLGVSKLLGTIAVLIPKFPLLKEWAYAGFFFTLLGALFSHAVSHDPFSAFVPAILLVILTSLSWYFRPANRKIHPST
jgi:hypothetical protein